MHIYTQSILSQQSPTNWCTRSHPQQIHSTQFVSQSIRLKRSNIPATSGGAILLTFMTTYAVRIIWPGRAVNLWGYAIQRGIRDLRLKCFAVCVHCNTLCVCMWLTECLDFFFGRLAYTRAFGGNSGGSTVWNSFTKCTYLLDLIVACRSGDSQDIVQLIVGHFFARQSTVLRIGFPKISLAHTHASRRRRRNSAGSYNKHKTYSAQVRWTRKAKNDDAWLGLMTILACVVDVWSKWL